MFIADLFHFFEDYLRVVTFLCSTVIYISNMGALASVVILNNFVARLVDSLHTCVQSFPPIGETQLKVWNQR